MMLVNALIFVCVTVDRNATSCSVLGSNIEIIIIPLLF